MNKISTAASNRIAWLSMAAAVLVVAIHAPSTRTHGFSFFCESLIGTHIASVAVPFFFAVSGFFLGRHAGEKGWYRNELRKRVRTPARLTDNREGAA